MQLKDDDIKSAHILVLDDNTANLDLLRDILELDGYTNVQLMDDPFAAERVIFSERPALVILDIRMPGMDGVELLTNLRETLAETFDYPPVLVMTAQQDAETKHRALSAGARDFVAKPFDAPELLQRVHNLVETRLLYNRHKSESEQLKLKLDKMSDNAMPGGDPLEKFQAKIMGRLSRIVAYRTNQMGNQNSREAQIAGIIARALGLDPSHIDHIEKATPLHDLGNIAIPQEILKKPGPLTAEEWDIVKSHTLVGAELLDGLNSPLFEVAKTVALSHHERWDGGGYPFGLAETEIAIEARIVAVADVYDALISPRPYREAWPQEKAQAYLRANAGSQFDPDVVSAILDNWEKVQAIGKSAQSLGANALSLEPA